MKSKFVTIVAALTAALSALTLSSCNTVTYDGFTAPNQGESTLKPVSSYYLERTEEDVKPVVEKALQTYSSENGACVIEKKRSYYEVTLDYEKGSPKEVGAAYAEMILEAYPDYKKMLEDYLYENIREAFGGDVTDYTALKERISTLKGSLAKKYQEEMEGFAEVLSDGEEEFQQNGKLSYEEAILINMVPDALRSTACSAITVNGNSTESGQRITARFLDWNLGSDNQICSAQCVTHFKNGDKSFTSVCLLGMLDVLTAVNPDGLVLGELDVGTNQNAKFVVEGKTCYSYDLRYAIENFSTAKEAGQYMVDNAHRYTFSCNALFTDDNDAFCAELCVDEQDGKPILRDSSTPMHKGLEWDNPDYFCIVNSFTSAGNSDKLTTMYENIVRWNKYNKLFCPEKNISLTRFKELITSEQVEDSSLINCRSSAMVHLLLVDYDTKSVQVLFGSPGGTKDKIKFIDIGTF